MCGWGAGRWLQIRVACEDFAEDLGLRETLLGSWEEVLTTWFGGGEGGVGGLSSCLYAVLEVVRKQKELEIYKYGGQDVRQFTCNYTSVADWCMIQSFEFFVYIKLRTSQVFIVQSTIAMTIQQL